MQNNKICSIICEKKLYISNNLVEKLNVLLENLIVKEDINIFIFTGTNSFNKICYKILTKLKNKYPFLKRIFKLDKITKPKWASDLDFWENLNTVSNAKKEKTEIISKSDFVLLYKSEKESDDKKTLEFLRQNRKPYIYLFE